LPVAYEGVRVSNAKTRWRRSVRLKENCERGSTAGIRTKARLVGKRVFLVVFALLASLRLCVEILSQLGTSPDATQYGIPETVFERQPFALSRESADCIILDSRGELTYCGSAGRVAIVDDSNKSVNSIILIHNLLDQSLLVSKAARHPQENCQL
jgi:hypothetical protein